MTPEARKDAREWGKYRAQELVRDMRSLAGDYATQWDVDPEQYLEAALEEVRRTFGAPLRRKS